MKRRLLALRRRRRAVELRRRGLIDARVDARRAHRLEQSNRPEPRHVSGVLGRLEAHLDMALRAEVVDLVGLDVTQEIDERRGVCQIAVVQEQAPALDMRVLVDPVEPLGVEARRAADDPVHLVALAEQQLGEVGAVLACDAGDQRALGRHGASLRQPSRSRRDARSAGDGRSAQRAAVSVLRSPRARSTYTVGQPRLEDDTQTAQPRPTFLDSVTPGTPGCPWGPLGRASGVDVWVGTERRCGSVSDTG